jgi:hypothetical protein
LKTIMNKIDCLHRAIRRVSVAMLLGVLAGAATAQNVGQVNQLQGIASAQRSGSEARFLAKGDTVAQGEVITTGERGYAVIGLADGTKLTLRPNTAFAVEALKQEPGSESLIMNLLRGGVRAVTGLISKTRPGYTRVKALTATIGIRGTEFDARLCGTDCRREAPNERAVKVPSEIESAVARIVRVDGNAVAVGKDGGTRPLAQGAAVFGGESVRTSADALAVLAFRDRSKITVVPKSEFKLEDIRYAGAAEEGNFIARLVTGGVRVVTGLIGKVNRSRVRFLTPTSTIGIRGTGLDIRLDGEDTLLHTWDGTATLESGGREIVVVAPLAGAFRAARGEIDVLPEIPRVFLEDTSVRPDRVEVDFDELFRTRTLEGTPPGLYVGVTKGNVGVGTEAGFIVDVGPFEAAYLAERGDRPVLIQPLPGFLFNDVFPRPDEAETRILRLIEIVGPGRDEGSQQCVVP